LAESLAKSRQEIIELKNIIRNYRRTVAISSDSLRSLDNSGKRKAAQAIKTNSLTISPENDVDNKENKIVHENIVTTSTSKKVSPEVNIAEGSKKKGSKRSAEKLTRDRQKSPEREDSIERLSNNTFSPMDVGSNYQVETTDKKNVKKKRRMSYAGHEISSNKQSDKSDTNHGTFVILSDKGENDSVQKSNAKGLKRRSSMGSLPSRDDINRMSLSPSRRPLRLRGTSVDYKEISLKKKMRSSFYIKNTDK